MINRMPDDKIWLGTRRGGLYIYDPHLKTIESSRYFDSNIYAVEEGADGSIWLGSRGNGLSIDGKWYTYHSDDPLSVGIIIFYSLPGPEEQNVDRYFWRWIEFGGEGKG